MLIIINFKRHLTGKSLFSLIGNIEKELPNSIVGIPSKYIHNLSEKSKLKLCTLYLDKKTPSYGAFLNHSDYPLNFNELKKSIEYCKKQKIKPIVFTPSISLTKKLITLKPYAIAYEDPKLIGTGKPITSFKSNNVKEFSKLFNGKKIIPLCGAGISSKEDILEAKKLGCKGVAISSFIVKSKNPSKILKEINSI